MESTFSLKNFSFKQFVRKCIRFVFWSHVALVAIVGVMCIYMIWFNPPTGTLILYRANFNFSNVKRPTPITMEEIPPIFIHDLMNAEDGNFRKHWGFDISAIKRAQELNKKAGHRAYGASTLTQQLARTLFLIPNKTYIRKYLELIIAIEMDLILSKDRILELYLTFAELGDKVYGVQDASQHYYKRNFSKISSDQRIRLLVILASPIKNGPYSFDSNRLLRKRYRNIRRWH
jgi:monofunctional glycosyltransferase